MTLAIAPCRPDEIETLRGLLAQPSLAQEFHALLEPGMLAQKFDDSFRDRDATLLARAGGEPVGACITFLIPRAGGGSWAAIRIGVSDPHRRLGVGSALLAEARRVIDARAIAGGLRDVMMGAWRPNLAGAAFAGRHGFRPDRIFWRMERSLAPVPEPSWPAGVELRIFDGGEPGLVDWTDAYNDSFAEHYRFVPGTLEHSRQIASAPLFLRDGLALAYLDRRCAGFCRNERAGRAGVVGVLGVARAARGIGLGRALLRWAIGYFAARDYERVELVVDGENESALALYRSEGFAVARTRDIWAKAAGPDSSAA